MGDGSRRLAVGIFALAVLWVATYWLWPAGDGEDAPPITFQNERGEAVQPRPVATQEADSEPPKPSDRAAQDPEPVETAPIRDPVSETSDSQATALPEPTGPLVLPPKFESYVVQRGDDLWSIAERRYGDKRHWQAIAQANGPGLDPQRLRVGQTIRLPVDPANVQGLPIDPETGEPIRPDRPSLPPAIEYTVKPGDTLSEIAQHFYGKATRWREIYEANRGALPTPEALRPGMRLMIPPPKDTARAALSDGD